MLRTIPDAVYFGNLEERLLIGSPVLFASQNLVLFSSLAIFGELAEREGSQVVVDGVKI